MSSAARLILIDACLSSLPLHTMGLFMLADGTHAGFDKHRNRFFWEGQGNKRKYHLVAWQEICKPRDQGGLGVMNTKLMNQAFMLKWIWRMLSGEKKKKLWLKLLRAKYRCNNFFNSNPSGGSPFWHSLHKLKHMFKLGAKFTPGPRSEVALWTNLWVGEVPLSTRFPMLFDKCSEPLLKVGQARVAGNWSIGFRRSLDPEEVEQWFQLVQVLNGARFDADRDRVSW
jgi:hypothetical protein